MRTFSRDVEVQTRERRTRSRTQPSSKRKEESSQFRSMEWKLTMQDTCFQESPKLDRMQVVQLEDGFIVDVKDQMHRSGSKMHERSARGKEGICDITKCRSKLKRRVALSRKRG